MKAITEIKIYTFDDVGYTENAHEAGEWAFGYRCGVCGRQFWTEDYLTTPTCKHCQPSDYPKRKTNND